MMHEQGTGDYQQQLQAARQLWDAEASVFDAQPDHGLRDATPLTAWTNLLQESLPSGKTDLLDMGCGTGSLSVICAQLGYTVTGADFSPDMLMLAEAKARAAHQTICFQQMDAAFPVFPAGQFDILLCRHVLWALREPAQVLHRWATLLKPAGCLLLIEGFWHTGAGLHAHEIVEQLPDSFSAVEVTPLSERAALWGGAVDDERYLIKATAHPAL